MCQTHLLHRGRGLPTAASKASDGDLNTPSDLQAWKGAEEEQSGQAEVDHHSGRSAWAGEDLPLQQDHVLSELVSTIGPQLVQQPMPLLIPLLTLISNHVEPHLLKARAGCFSICTCSEPRCIKRDVCQLAWDGQASSHGHNAPVAV